MVVVVRFLVRCHFYKRNFAIVFKRFFCCCFWTFSRAKFSLAAVIVWVIVCLFVFRFVSIGSFTGFPLHTLFVGFPGMSGPKVLLRGTGVLWSRVQLVLPASTAGGHVPLQTYHPPTRTLSLVVPVVLLSGIF
jgi:hypothetical protein